MDTEPLLDPLAVAEELIELTKTLSTERRLEALLGAVVTSARRLTRAEGGRALVLDRTGRHFHGMVGQNEAAPEAATLAGEIPVYDNRHAFNLRDANVFAAVTGKIVNLADIYAYSPFDFTDLHRWDERTGYRTRSFVAAPLWSIEGATLGVLQLINVRITAAGEAGPLPKVFERVVASFAAHAAVAIANARLFEENRELIRQLNRRNADLTRENSRLKAIAAQPPDAQIIGESAPFRAALDLARRAASSSVAVLLLGETGTGKDVFANAIHRLGKRSGRPFVAQNCAALPETLLESELFGHRKGAFSGALADKKGLVQEANGGTLFLDEIGDMPLPLQAKILRLLEDGSVRRLGDTRMEKVDVRIVAATNADLPLKISQGLFREDLYYRLSTFPVIIPPLRERPSDIPLLIDFFLHRIARSHGHAVFALTPRALEALCRWRYPGNIRELKNIAERAALLIDGDERIDLRHLPPHLARSAPEIMPQQASLPAEGDGSLRSAVQHYEAIVIERRMREAGWNQSRAAELLQISRRSLVDKLQRYAIKAS
ncbi:sigma-54 interaction domain-containing protein [Methylobacterium persicinum]|uniref:Sigma-54-dependent transcriptional regulator n=1 Tax=Methylobacterium persicinum TaxID=374426 RepID=A0ABU0HKZ1_9HYPH|nr:sigma 54-interacting transcriptional regulator [Methylobacterium persicinum]MDQ0442981.1 sigma-54-dependent transcriptional regulator [Methylobacterium persicinum]GJE40227.1 Anaerobic nitric oxide reductase transcription regulator NorR [Methylobacterium persicinum]